jgi:DNA polymerase III subunit delta'
MRITPFATWPLQNEALKPLHHRLEQNECPHAMLFVGPGDQTESLTEYLAQLLLCTGEVSPCGTCNGCLQWKAGNHPDYSMVDVSATGTVKAAQIEAVQEKLVLRAHAGGRTVYVLRGVDIITPVAANRLLKTLEEPAPSVIALLTASNLQRVLPTIVSRCFIYRLTTSTQGGTWADAQPAAIAHPEMQPEKVSFAGVLEPVVQWAEKLLSQTEYPFVLADSMVKMAIDIELSDVLQILASWLQGVMHFAAGDRQYIQYPEHQDSLEQQAKLATINQLATMIQIVLQSRSRLQSHVAAQLNCEQMCIRLREVLRCV